MPVHIVRKRPTNCEGLPPFTIFLCGEFGARTHVTKDHDYVGRNLPNPFFLLPSSVDSPFLSARTELFMIPEAKNIV